MTPGLFAVNQMTDNLKRTPLPEYRPRDNVLLIHIGDDAPKLCWTIYIGINPLYMRRGWHQELLLNVEVKATGGSLVDTLLTD
jgi:hypothetical protein